MAVSGQAIDPIVAIKGTECVARGLGKKSTLIMLLALLPGEVLRELIRLFPNAPAPPTTMIACLAAVIDANGFLIR
jgi:hypothetical protein